jgi:hypothetical protein
MSITVAHDLALSRLNRDLRSERLGSALVEVSPDGNERVTWLSPSDWLQRTVTPLEPIRTFRVAVEPYAAGHYYVRRADLDKWYPDPATPTVTAARQSDDVQPPKPRRRKPGPKIRYDWRLHVAVEVHRLKESGKGTPSASQLAQFCYDKWKWQPDESDIQKLLKYLANE